MTDHRPVEISTRAYRGWRDEDGRTHVEVVGYDGRKPLDPRLDLRNHSPHGFDWGYRGSGPAQLALAILADYLGDDERALRLYQVFKESVLLHKPEHGFSLDSPAVDRAIAFCDQRTSHTEA